MTHSPEFVIRRAAQLNLDDILQFFTAEYAPDEIRKDLFCVYSTLADYFLYDPDKCGSTPELANAMFALSTLIKYCDTLKNVEERKLAIGVALDTCKEKKDK